MPDRRTAGSTAVVGGGPDAASVLARSYLRHHPDHAFVVLVADVWDLAAGTAGDSEPTASAGLTGSFEPGAVTVLSARDLGLPADDYLRLATCGTSEQLVQAAAPLLVRRLLATHDLVVHLGADSVVLAPLPDFGDGLTLVPKLLHPLPDDGRHPARVGGFTENFVAVGRSGESFDTEAFVDFWADRTRADLLAGSPEGWAADAAALFEHRVARDPGIGVAAWNLHEREPAGTRLIDFTGHDPEQPWLAARDHDRVLLSERPEWRAVYDLAPRRPTRASNFDTFGASGTSTDGSTNGSTDGDGDGEKITPTMREVFKDALRAAAEPDPLDTRPKTLPPHPFDGDGSAFKAWLTSPATPAQRASGMNRLLHGVWQSRIDLRAAFPRPLDALDPGFRDWCTRHGVDEGIPTWALPVPPREVAPPVDAFGVNVAGYHTAELGIGEMGRVILNVVEAAGIPHVSVVDEHSVRGTARTGVAAPDSVGRPRYPVSLITVNGDFTRPLLEADPEVGHGRYRIGLWAWELAEFPATMHHFGFVDEVWTVSDFVRRAVEPHSPVPVRTVPIPVVERAPVRAEPRRPGETTGFLFAFDFNSTAQRKNPWGVVTAFQRAFPGRTDVKLVIKSTNAHLHTGAAERLRLMTADDPRITLVERYLGAGELAELYATSHAYVSLHRSEGFGLTVAEAMMRGLAVVSTDYGGTSEFVTPAVGWPVPHTMTEVGEGWPPYQPNARWADPDLDAAARAMREIADDPDEAHRRGLAAREHLLRTRSFDAAAAWLRTRLDAAHRTWLARTTPPHRPPLVRAARRVLGPAAGPIRHALGRVEAILDRR
ncbi:glycosyltransferase involved in cell wall biosynthesis [Saccharothrix tamanrassetensis]|uniref:Glycosyltransferase involved in cell wall biosynthesis n=1 Tax=Saccharothrix tamanrassetensis TaxID=1051531 RepID=A0A841CS24_9PSEU|nr:glycosyltransferase family 4 protein [Saccharothrix tamanrassetensis]MBB5958775.1 glycosyltransferase involved in cell wall biosynthesis [Saccharothrix tamanrassetensis]